MNLHLLYFGIVREKLGRTREERRVADGITVAELMTELAGDHGIFALGAGSLRVAVNREYVGDSHVLADQDEVAVIPPVAGGAPQAHGAEAAAPLARITGAAIDLGSLVSFVSDPSAGAVATFLGTTRATNRGRSVLKLEYEAYDEMAVAEFVKIAARAAERWEITRVAIVHRKGTVPLGEASVAIAVSAPHRFEAIEACHYCIDALKQVAPIWKKEHFEGGEVWIGSLADCDHGDGGDSHEGAGHPHETGGHSRRGRE
ncbi:MAG TPA: molybdopterin converting factor subunit 1 [Candidatus Binatia bacterium]